MKMYACLYYMWVKMSRLMCHHFGNVKSFVCLAEFQPNWILACVSDASIIACFSKTKRNSRWELKFEGVQIGD